MCIQFFEKLADAVIPDPPRTREMIMQGMGHRLIFMNEVSKGGQADLSEEIFVCWGGRPRGSLAGRG